VRHCIALILVINTLASISKLGCKINAGTNFQLALLHDRPQLSLHVAIEAPGHLQKVDNVQRLYAEVEADVEIGEANAPRQGCRDL
jgi:hypothetical protein